MRTTLDIEVLSDLARQALEPRACEEVRTGAPLLPRGPAGSPKITPDLVNRLRDEP